MGLTDWIPGLHIAEKESTDEDIVDTLYLADEKTWNTELRAYRIMIGPDTETDDHEWTVYRCTEDDTKIPSGSKLFVFEEGRVVSDGDRSFQLHLAQLILDEDAVDQARVDGYFVEFPDELADEVYSEHTRIDDDELSQYLTSLPSDF